MDHPITIAQRGFDVWKDKEHNAKWFRKIDGTPIPNDLVVCIAMEFVEALKEAQEPAASFNELAAPYNSAGPILTTPPSTATTTEPFADRETLAQVFEDICEALGVTSNEDALAEIERLKAPSAMTASAEPSAKSVAHYLDNLEYQQTGRDPKANGYAYAKVPEWQLRQWGAALATPPSDAAREALVKPLEWILQDHIKYRPDVYADTIIGRYVIMRDPFVMIVYREFHDPYSKRINWAPVTRDEIKRIQVENPSGGGDKEFEEAKCLAQSDYRSHILAALSAAPVSADTLDGLHAKALTAAIAFEEKASINETDWTGWGEQIVPPGATMARVKGQQAVAALRDAWPLSRHDGKSQS